VHGLGVSPRHFEPLIRVLRRDWLVAAPHLPMGPSVAELAALLAEDLPAPAVVFANSMGCQIGVEVAVRRPELVLGLVLVGPTTDTAAATLTRQLLRLAADTPREPLRLNWIVATDYFRSGFIRTLRSARSMVEHRLPDLLPRVQAPTVVVRGERDPIAPQPWAQHLAALLPQGRLEVVRGAAHCAHFTHPEVVAAIAPVPAGPA
jgi:2-hydroxy-6-oxonona-2,4-dienedioate hydrolase